jgi:hypothetical protein
MSDISQLTTAGDSISIIIERCRYHNIVDNHMALCHDTRHLNLLTFDWWFQFDWVIFFANFHSLSQRKAILFSLFPHNNLLQKN